MTREKVLTVTLKDCEVNTFTVGGAGGQRRDHTNTGVRVKHPPSGAVGESRDSRVQHDNKRAAFLKMVNDPRFTYWVSVQTKQVKSEAALRAEIEAIPDSEYRVEYKDGGRWTVVQ